MAPHSTSIIYSSSFYIFASSTSFFLTLNFVCSFVFFYVLLCIFLPLSLLFLATFILIVSFFPSSPPPLLSLDIPFLPHPLEYHGLTLGSTNSSCGKFYGRFNFPQGQGFSLPRPKGLCWGSPSQTKETRVRNGLFTSGIPALTLSHGETLNFAWTLQPPNNIPKYFYCPLFILSVTSPGTLS